MNTGTDDKTKGTDAPQTPEERRAHRRVRGPFDAVRMGLLEFQVRVYDLSAGGCLIDSPTPITTEQPIRLRLALPDGNFAIVRGQVTLPLRDVGYAVRFIDLDEATRRRIEQALEHVQIERAQR